MLKHCTKCKTTRTISMFYLDITKPDGFDSWCKLCRIKYKTKNKKIIAQSRRKNARKYQLKHKFGMTKDEYRKLLKQQKEKCGICRQHRKSFTRDLCVDHSHKTGLVRGLLCHKCNAALGLFGDKIQLLSIAIDWIRQNGNIKR